MFHSFEPTALVDCHLKHHAVDRFRYFTKTQPLVHLQRVIEAFGGQPINSLKAALHKRILKRCVPQTALDAVVCSTIPKSRGAAQADQ
ncbi:MAG: hypothetical protein EBR82_82095 [Caulobacteraceae bacterium]|nr:hypothetical protein [Caulobacteraceae bacterium]